MYVPSYAFLLKSLPSYISYMHVCYLTIYRKWFSNKALKTWIIWILFSVMGSQVSNSYKLRGSKSCARDMLSSHHQSFPFIFDSQTLKHRVKYVLPEEPLLGHPLVVVRSPQRSHPCSVRLACENPHTTLTNAGFSRKPNGGTFATWTGMCAIVLCLSCGNIYMGFRAARSDCKISEWQI